MPGKCFISVKKKHFLPKCARSSPWQEMTRLSGQKGQGRKNISHMQSVTNYSLSAGEQMWEEFFWIELPVSKPGRQNSSQWINKPPAMLGPCISSAVGDTIVRRFFFKGLFFSQMSPISFSVLWIEAEFLFSSFGIILWYVKLNSIAGNFLPHLMNSLREKICIYRVSAESKKLFQVYI